MEEQVTNDLKNAFKKLDLNSQRNEYSVEMIKLAALINTWLAKYTDRQFKMPYNYDLKKDESLTESELITINYMDLLEIKNNLILLLSFIEKNNK